VGSGLSTALPLALEQMYGAMTFYLGHQQEVDASIGEAERAGSGFKALSAQSMDIRG